MLSFIIVLHILFVFDARVICRLLNPARRLKAAALASLRVVTWIDGKRYSIFHKYPRATADADSVAISSNTGTTFHPRVAVYSSSGFLSAFKIGSTTIPFTSNADGTGGVFGYPGFTRTSFALSTHFTEAVNYDINVLDNEIRKAKFSLYEAVRLLDCLEIELVG